MYRKLLLTAALATAFVAPAFAAAPAWYVEQSAKTHKCAVTEKKPNGKTEMEVGTVDYKTQVRRRDGDEGRSRVQGVVS